jgi:hypothetical protein
MLRCRQPSFFSYGHIILQYSLNTVAASVLLFHSFSSAITFSSNPNVSAEARQMQKSEDEEAQDVLEDMKMGCILTDTLRYGFRNLCPTNPHWDYAGTTKKGKRE